MVDKTRRELLAEAFDKSVEEENEDEVVVEESPGNDGDLGRSSGSVDGSVESSVEESDSTKDGLVLDGRKTDVSDAKAKKTEKVGKKPAQTEEEKQEAAAARADAEGKAGKEGQQPVVTDKAPNSWKPATREHWAKIPAEARAEITRREKEIQVTLSQTANIRKFAGDFAAVINPFAHLMRAQNSTPLQAVHNLMSTAAGLMTGTEEQKSAIVAEIIQNYGVDCDILDQILSAVAKKNGGKIPRRNGAAPQEQIPTWAKPILDSHQNMQRMQQQHEERMREEADQEISKVENEPFFDDLREDIADIMEISANRGRKISVKEAYQRAIEFNPEIKKLVAQRTLSLKGNQNRSTMTRARRAASTISGSPNAGKAVSGKGGGEAKTRREQLAEAWENATE